MSTQNKNQNSGIGFTTRLLTSAIVALSAGAAALAHDHHGGRCVSGDVLSVMFAPEASDEVIAHAQAELVSPMAFLAQGSRWSNTATNGATVQGQAITITYSFVPDGTALPGSLGEPATPSSLFATFDANFPGGRAAWKAKFAEAFARWSEFSNITFVEVSDDGATFPTAVGQLGARGDIRIAMHPVNATALAYMFFPQFGGDMVIDSNDIGLFSNPTNNFRNLRNMLAHELGHGLGLGHVLPANNTKIMEPNLVTAVDGPQEDDIRGMQFIYGDSLEANETLETSQFVGGPLRDPAQDGTVEITVEDAAIERADAADFFGFTAFAGVPIAIRVEPVGTTYAFGPQDSNTTTTVDAQAARNLGLRLWRRTSAANNTFQMLAQINFNQAGEAEYHPPIPYTQAGFMVAEVFSTDGINDVQRYQLTISNVAITAPVEPSDLRVFDGLDTELGDDDTVLFAATNVGQSSSKTITLFNAGTGPLEIGSVTVQGPAAGDYSFTLITSVVQPGQSAFLAMSFTPSQAGQRVAVVTIPNNDPDRGNFGFIVTGTAAAPPPPPPPPAPITDCNINGVEDATDLANGTSLDCNVNAIPDECEVDTDQDGVIDDCDNCPDVANTDQVDTDNNGIGDVCDEVVIEEDVIDEEVIDEEIIDEEVVEEDEEIIEEDEEIIEEDIVDDEEVIIEDDEEQLLVDCNENGFDDLDDIDFGDSADCNGNDIPDECERDFDSDGVIDACDNCPGVSNPQQRDSNNDGVGDACTQQNEDREEQRQVEEDDPFGDAGLCGIGSAGMIPLMMLGLCGMKAGTRRRLVFSN